MFLKLIDYRNLTKFTISVKFKVSELPIRTKNERDIKRVRSKFDKKVERLLLKNSNSVYSNAESHIKRHKSITFPSRSRGGSSAVRHQRHERRSNDQTASSSEPHAAHEAELLGLAEGRVTRAILRGHAPDREDSVLELAQDDWLQDQFSFVARQPK